MRHRRIALALATLAMGASMQMSGVASADPVNPRGTCNLGGQSLFRAESGGGAFGCAGNVGGEIFTRNGKEVCQGTPFRFEGFCNFEE